MLEVTLLYFDGCPNWEVTDARLAALAGEYDVRITHRLVEDAEEAEELGFRGSPTVFLDGTDPFARGDEPVGFACRVYVGDEGYEGSVPQAQLRAAIEARLQAR